MITGSFSSHALQGVRTRLPLLVQMLFWLFMATAASQAATYTVNSTSDLPLSAGMCDGSGTCTLRAAIQAANATSNIADTINLPAGTYLLTIPGTDEDLSATGDLDITDINLTITGAGSGSTIIDGNGTDRVFHIISGATATLSAVTIRNGTVHGDIGGGIYNAGTLSVDSSTISGNSADDTSASGGNGGGAYNGGTMTIGSSTISGNTANTSIAGNGGGGIYNAGTLTVTNCAIDSNQASGNDAAGGGGIQNVGSSGIGANAIRTTITGSTLSNNTAPLGAAVRNLFARVDIDTTVIENNTATFSGGGIENGSSGGMGINRSVIRNNIAPQNGGGIENVSALDISNSTISGNQSLGLNPGAGGAGGGIFNSGAGALTLVSSTVSGNQARVGGGVYNHKDANITNATIYDNSATSNGTEIFACGNKDEANGLGCDNQIQDSLGNFLITTNIVNTIVGNSSTTDNCNGDVVDLITSDGHNLETADSCGFAGSGDIVNASSAALFSSGLQYNGGDISALLTFAIPNTSPAHNAGDFARCPLIDERGFDRNDTKDNLCDIGAYEISSTNTSFAVLDLALDIQYKNAAPLSGTVQTTINLSVVNKGPIIGNNIVLTGSLPVLSWLKITNVGPGSNNGSCSQTSTGFVCTIASLEPYTSADFFAVTIASAAGSYTLDGEVKADQADNFRPDNLKSITVSIPTVSGSSVGGNNFAGSGGGGGGIGWLSLMALLVPAARRVRRR